MTRSLVHTAGLAALAAAALAVGLAVTPADAAVPTATYYASRAVCAAPAAGHRGCLVQKRVTVRTTAAKAKAMHARRPTTRVPGVTYGPAGGYTPATLAKVYGVNANAATTQRVAVVDAYNYTTARDDLNTFDEQNGLPDETSSSLQIVNQLGKSSPLPADDTTGWSTEEALDLQAVRGVCHKCTIVLVEANSSDSPDLDTAVNTAATTLKANEISNSYGGAETDSDETPAQFAADAKAYNHPGVVITASTGDDGMYDWDNANYDSTKTGSGYEPSAESPEVPSSLNTVIAVGGTSLQLNDDGSRASESVWNTNGQADLVGGGYQKGAGATGGGCSTKVSAQTWQKAVANYSGTACGSKRLAADVSALADPFTGYDIYDSMQIANVNQCTAGGCWATYGGTSLASPIIAALWALAGGAHGLKYPSLALYGHSKSATGSLYDVTAGGNGFCGGVSPGSCQTFTASDSDPNATPNSLGSGTLDCAWQSGDNDEIRSAGTRACDAATGYDGPSGVGTPKGISLVQPLTPTVKLTAPTVTHGKSATFTGSATDPYPGGTISKYSWSFGDGSAASTSGKHTYKKAGKYTVTLTATDSYGVSGKATKTITVK